jgi:hypothetical protein
MINLKILNISGSCNVDQKGFEQLNLFKLTMYNNQKIININHMTNLKILSAYGNEKKSQILS